MSLARLSGVIQPMSAGQPDIVLLPGDFCRWLCRRGRLQSSCSITPGEQERRFELRPAEPVIVTGHSPDVFGQMCLARCVRPDAFAVAPATVALTPAGHSLCGAPSSMSRLHLASRSFPCASASPRRSLSSPCAGSSPAVSRRSPAGWIIRAGPLVRPSPGPWRPAHETWGDGEGGGADPPAGFGKSRLAKLAPLQGCQPC